ncbi:hypothetical protein STEG23_016115 [Scotinomys teguina]
MDASTLQRNLGGYPEVAVCQKGDCVAKLRGDIHLIQRYTMSGKIALAICKLESSGRPGEISGKVFYEARIPKDCPCLILAKFNSLFPVSKLFSLCNILLTNKFIYMVYYIDRLSYVEPSLHLWDKAYLVMGDNVFDVFLENLSISSRFSNFVEYRFLKYDLMILLISSLSVVISPISFLILLIWMLSLSLPFGDFASSSSRAFSFNLVDLSVGKSGVLKSPTINVWYLMLESSF